MSPRLRPYLVAPSPALSGRADGDFDRVIGLLGAEVAIASLHHPARPPLLLANRGLVTDLAADAVARLERDVRFERRRRGEHQHIEIDIGDGDAPAAPLAAWSFPLQRDAMLLLTLDQPTLPAWVEPFVDLWWRRRCADDWHDGLRGALDQIDLGVVLLDGDGGIAFANAGAERLLDRGDGVRRLGHSLGAAGFEDAVRLQTAIGRALQSDGRAAPPLLLKRGRGRPIIASVVRTGSAAGPISGPAAAVYLLDPDADVDPLLGPVCDGHDLTAAEARLARALVAGSTLTEAAAAQRIRLDTARSYLKQVFAKTGTHRQAELVRVMLSSVLRAGLGPQA